MRHMRMMLGVLITIILLAGCCHKDKDSPAVRAAIDARNKEIGAAVAAGNSAAVAALYTADALLMPPNLPALRGREAIEGLWKNFIASGIKGLELSSSEVESHGDSADEEGVYKVLGPEGQVLDTGKYIVVWAQQDGQWFLHRDIWNSDSPPPPPPPPPPAPADAAAPPPPPTPPG